MKLLYFAWVRAKIGIGQEEVPLPDGVATVADLLDWLRTRGDGYRAALAHPATIRVAVNLDYADFDQPLADSDEVALFPPVTGG